MHAQDGPGSDSTLPPPDLRVPLPQDAPPPPPREVSITFSPLHLILPAVEMHIESRLADKHGFSLAGRWGSRVFRGAGDIRLYGVGSQYRYYAFGDFDQGAMIALETWYNYEREVDEGFESDVEIFDVGPCVGYKFILDNGFTFVAQAGARVEWTRGVVEEAEERRRGTRTEYSGFFNLDIGWSF